MRQRRKVFIVGGYGFVGYHLAKHLLSTGHDVILFGRKSEARAELFKDLVRVYGTAIECRYGELPDFEGKLHKMAHNSLDIDVVVHLAAMTATTQTRDREAGAMLAHNYDCDLEVFDFAQVMASERSKDARMPRLVYLSSAEVYGMSFIADHALTELAPLAVRSSEKRFIYPVSKIAGEMMLQHGGWDFEWNIIRLQNPYGPLMRNNTLIPKLMHAAMEANAKGSFEIILSNGNDTRPFVHISDVVAGIVSVIERAPSGRTYNLAGAVDINIDYVADKIKHWFSADKLVVRLEGTKPAEHRRVNTAQIMMDTGWVPKMSIEAGLKQMWSWYSKNDIVARSMASIGLKI